MLLRAPEGWPQPLVATIAMVLLAGLDLGGSFAAKEAVDRRSPGLAVLGAGLFLAVFWVYISSLEVAELSSVTFGWIVILQVGVVLLDRFRYHVMPAPGAWLAITILLCAQAYLVLAPVAKPAPTSVSTTPTSPSTESDDQGIETVHDQVPELSDPQCQAGTGTDQQCVPNGLVSGIGHISPQRKPESSHELTTQM